jgi:hypothetical protein
MDGIGTAAIAVASALVFAVLLVLVIRVVARSIEKKRAAEVMRRFAGQEILGATSNALFFGRESRGKGQVRGNGVLVLTPELLYFEMWAPKRRFAIPLESISAVSAPKSHLGKSRFRPLLKVEYKNPQGQADSCAWLIKNLETWHGALSRIVEMRERTTAGNGGDHA